MPSKTKNAQLIKLLDALESWTTATHVDAAEWKRLECLRNVIEAAQGIEIDWCNDCGGTGDATPATVRLPRDPQDHVECHCLDTYSIVEID